MRTVDTDVVVILACTFHDLIVIRPLADIWVAFGMSKNYRFFHMNAICASLGEPRSRALPVLHAFPCCDTISAFNGKGKKSVWQAWHVYEDMTETFVYLTSHPFQLLDVDNDHFKKIERLTVILYDKMSLLRLSTIQKGNSSVTRIEQWTNCHPPMMCYSSMSDMQCIKQESGRPAQKHS